MLFVHLDIAFRELLLCTNLLYPTLTFWLHVTVKAFVPMGIVFTNVVKLEERIENTYSSTILYSYVSIRCFSLLWMSILIVRLHLSIFLSSIIPKVCAQKMCDFRFCTDYLSASIYQPNGQPYTSFFSMK